VFLVRSLIILTDRRNITKFVPEGEDRNSSSIVDLFGSLNSPIEFILDLEWPDEYHNARFMTRLASVSFFEAY
jgi:hypothetical protein